MKRYVALVLLLSLLALLLLVQASKADGYCRPRVIYSTYSAPSYVAPTYSAPAYVAPSHEYTPTYVKAVKAYVSPDYYSSVTDYYRDKILVDAVAGRTAELMKGQQELQTLREEVQLLRRQLGPPPQPQYQPQSQPQPEPPVSPPPSPQRAPAAGTMPRAAVGNLPPVPEKLKAVVQQSCVRCHGATADRTGGGLALQDLAAVPRESRLLAYTLVNTGEMPRGGKPVSDEDTLAFYAWATGREASAQAAPKK